MTALRTSAVAVALLLGMAAAGSAQAGRQRAQRPGRAYDKATETTMTGTVENVQHTPAAGRGLGVCISP